MNKYTIAVVGQPNSGKTTYVNNFSTPQTVHTNAKLSALFKGEPRPFIEMCRTTVFDSSIGKIKVSFVESNIPVVADATIFLLTTDIVGKSYRDINETINAVSQMMPTCVAWNNKAGQDGSGVITLITNWLWERDGKLKQPHYEISATSRYNFDKPVQCLLRQLTGDPKLVLV